MRHSLSDKFFKVYAEGFPEDSLAFFRHFLTMAVDCAYETADGEIVSVGFLAEKSAVICGKPCKVGYLGGLCTLKEHRRKGYIGRIIGRLAEKAAERDYPLIFLSPFNDLFYLKYGFRDLIRCDDIEREGGGRYDVTQTINPDPGLLKHIYNQCVSDCSNYLVLGDEQAAAKVKEFACDGVPVSIVSDRGKPIGFFFNGGGKIDYWAGRSDTVRGARLSGKVTFKIFSDSGARSFLQVRAGNILRLTSIMNLKGIAGCEIKDALIRQNNTKQRLSGAALVSADSITERAVNIINETGKFFLDMY